jgi:disulfide bond formation protein DsbB
MSTLIALASVILGILLVLGVIYYFYAPSVLAGIASKSHIILSVVFIGATLGSIYYSDIVGFAPCLLCWYQRIFIFGIALLSLTSNIGKSALLRRQVILFSSIGAAIALFHNILGWFPTGITVCGTSGVSCTILYVNTFGFVTIPLMSLITLLAGLGIALLAKRYPQA